MNTFRKTMAAGVAGIFMLALGACAPEIGSDKWCANMKAKPKGDWSTNETVDFAKHCILK